MALIICYMNQSDSDWETEAAESELHTAPTGSEMKFETARPVCDDSDSKKKFGEMASSSSPKKVKQDNLLDEE